MSRRSAQTRAGRLEVWIPNTSEEAASDQHKDVALSGRQVEGSSIADLNVATHGLGKRIPRVLDVFTMGLVYAYRLRDIREYSPLENPAPVSELTEKLGELAREVPSLAEQVVADVVDVKSYRGEVAVYVDYPSLLEEQFTMAKTLSEHLDLPHLHNPAPRDPRIVIIQGDVSREEQILRIANAVPDQLSLSPLKPLE